MASVQPDTRLREKLRKIEALYAGAATAGEKAAAAAAADRIRKLFESASRKERPDEFAPGLFIATCRLFSVSSPPYAAAAHGGAGPAPP